MRSRASAAIRARSPSCTSTWTTSRPINDSSGHGIGDRLLQSIGHVMTCSVRATDLAARLGGDEFVVLMPETDRLAAGQVARRVRENLARVELPDGRPLQCSIGVATLATPPADVDELIRHADELMYRAKQRGKDRIEMAYVAAAGILRGRSARDSPRGE